MKRHVPSLLTCVTLVAACGSPGNTATGTFTIDFPSTAAAIAVLKSTPGVQVFVYDTSVVGMGDAAAAGACQELVQESIENNIMFTATTTSALISPCDLMSGKGSIAMPYGSYAFLAVAQTSSGHDLLVGCAEQTISSSNTVVSIAMAPAGATPIKTTTCTTLSQACPSGDGC